MNQLLMRLPANRFKFWSKKSSLWILNRPSRSQRIKIRRLKSLMRAPRPRPPVMQQAQKQQTQPPKILQQLQQLQPFQRQLRLPKRNPSPKKRNQPRRSQLIRNPLKLQPRRNPLKLQPQIRNPLKFQPLNLSLLKLCQLLPPKLKRKINKVVSLSLLVLEDFSENFLNSR